MAPLATMAKRHSQTTVVDARLALRALGRIAEEAAISWLLRMHCSQLLSGEVEIISRQFEVRFVSQSLFTRGGGFIVFTHLVIRSAAVVPCFGVAGSKVERAPAGDN